MASKAVYNDTKIRVKGTKLQPRTRYTVEVTDLTSGAQASFSQNSRRGTFTKTVHLKTKGVVRTIIRDAKGGVVKESYSVSTAEIDCCIAKLVHDAINCTCKCNKCDEDLKRAQTIHLLLQSAKHEAHVLGAGDLANAKVLKAKELCTEVCACGC
jgi:hypothetical protein